MQRSPIKSGPKPHDRREGTKSTAPLRRGRERPFPPLSSSSYDSLGGSRSENPPAATARWCGCWGVIREGGSWTHLTGSSSSPPLSVATIAATAADGDFSPPFLLGLLLLSHNGFAEEGEGPLRLLPRQDRHSDLGQGKVGPNLPDEPPIRLSTLSMPPACAGRCRRGCHNGGSPVCPPFRCGTGSARNNHIP